MNATAARFRQSPGALSRVLTDSVLVSAGGELHELTGPAVAAWWILDAPRTPAALVEMLSRFYGLEAGSIAIEVDVVLDDLVARGVVEEIVDADV